MHDTDKNNFYYLNREGLWPDFTLTGLDLASDGSLRLTSVPSLSAPLSEDVKSAPIPAGPSGLAIDSTGTVYFSVPGENRIVRVLACDASLKPLLCLGGAGSQPTRFESPRGLLIPSNRDALFVADSGNHRIQIFDLATSQLLAIWGQSGLTSSLSPGTAPGEFDTPWALVEDHASNIYVLDYGNRRIQKFTPAGDVVPSFSTNVQSSDLLKRPSAIAVVSYAGKSRLLVLDLPPAKPPSFYLFDLDGRPVKKPNSSSFFVFQDSRLQQPMGLAARGNRLFVGENSARCILEYRLDPALAFVGEAIGYLGPVASLLCAQDDTLWAHCGLCTPPVSLLAGAGYAPRGILTRAPLSVPDRPVTWHRLQGLLSPLAPGAHLELFAATGDDDSYPPAVDVTAANPFADPRWQPVAVPGHSDVTDLYIGGCQASFLWVAALFTGNGAATPMLNQLRVEFDYPGYERFLPAVYTKRHSSERSLSAVGSKTGECGEFLKRLLSLFQAMFGDIESEIASLPTLFDPFAAPTEFLPWLAGCLDFDLDENWSETKKRQAVADAFQLYGWRGTPEGLREALRLYAGVDAVIVEPLQHAAWWSLPSVKEACCDSCAAGAASGAAWQDTGGSILGWTTMLAPAQPQGAVVGTSADLDESHLITSDQFGAPLFTDIAYQFSVQVLRGQLNCPDVIARVRAVLDREKPAHTAYHLCVVEPRMRVGFQSRVGIDSVVGGGGRSLSLGSGQVLGEGTPLGGPTESRLGAGTRLGLSTRLS
jgi:phage tail-like protein